MNRLMLVVVCALAAHACSLSRSAPQQTPVVGLVADVDPFLWLEDISGERSMNWVRAQNERSLAVLTGDKRFGSLYQDALAILGSDSRIPYGKINAGYVYNFWQDTQHVRGLWRRADLASFRRGEPRWQTLLDVDDLARREGRNWVFGSVDCLAPDYLRCMIGLSDGGTDASSYREFSTDTLTFVSGGFTLPEAKSSVTWLDENRLIVATDYGTGTMTDSGYPSVAKVWRRGEPLASAAPLFSGELTDVGVFVTTLRDAEQVWPVVVQATTFFDSRVHVRMMGGDTVTLPLPRRVNLVDMVDGKIVAHLKQSWEHGGVTYPADSLVALELDAARQFPATLVYAPGPSEALEQVEAGQDDIYVVLLDDVIGRIKRLSPGALGWRATNVDMPANGTVSISSANGKGNDLLVSYESLTVPDSLFYVDDANAVTRVQSLPSMYDATDVVVEQRFATSRDGTRVPYFIMAKKDVLARGRAPTIQYGYGGFEVSILPHYYEDPGRPQHGALAGRLWVERGGVLVLSNIRGGGEYGPAWHKAALKENRQRAFDDFFAIGDALVSTGVTTPDKLGAIGRSNGGLLMGAAMIQRPDLYAAIDCGVPLLDMLRYHKLLAGASWMGEYGDPDDPQQRAYIARYSPYQALRKDADYPQLLFYTSTKDDRVHPGHARKMAARMDAFGHDFLYYENIEGGHGGTANQEQLAYRTALEFVFFMQALM
jgi:prolyl oligopeptidase